MMFEKKSRVIVSRKARGRIQVWDENKVRTTNVNIHDIKGSLICESSSNPLLEKILKGEKQTLTEIDIALLQDSGVIVEFEDD